MSTPTARRPLRRRTVLPLVAGCLAVAAVPALAGIKPADEADLAIAKTSDATAYAPGETIAYLITVTNAGEAAVPVADILVSDPQLADLTPAGATDGALDPGESLRWVGSRTTSAADCGTLENTATVALRGDKKGLRDVNPANDSATHVVEVAGEACAPPVGVASVASRPAAPPSPAIQEAMPQSEAPSCPAPRLRAAVRGPGTLGAGESAAFTVTLRNAAGAPAAKRARLAVRLPSGFALAGSVKRATMVNGAMEWSLGTLRPRASRTVTVTLRADRTIAGRRALSATATARCGSARATALVRVAQATQTQVRPAVTG
jgi:uncharacterized repeat protein (TIGR01451 family)